MTLAEKKYLYNGFKTILMEMGVQIEYFPLTGSIQNKNGKVQLQWNESGGINTWGSISYNNRQDYSIGRPTETSTENRVSFLKSDFETFSISPRPKDALDITVAGVTTRYVIIGDESGADFPELFYVANIDTLPHINP